MKTLAEAQGVLEHAQRVAETLRERQKEIAADLAAIGPRLSRAIDCVQEARRAVIELQHVEPRAQA